MSIKTIKEKVLVIGKTGQVASELFVLQPHWIYTDRSVCDLSDPKTFEKQLLNHIESSKPTILVNASAYTKVDLAEEESSLCDNINHHAVQVMAKLCRDQKIKFIHLSTDYVFDGCKNTPYKENDLPSPQNIYGASKLRSEQAVAASGCKYVIYRTSWVYSSYGANFLKTMLKLIPQKDLNIVYDQVGCPTLASDIANLIITSVEQDFFTNKIYHFSHEGVASWFDFATAIKRLFLPSSSHAINPIESSAYPQKAKRPNYSVMSKDLIKQELGIRIDHWYDALNKYQA